MNLIAAAVQPLTALQPHYQHQKLLLLLPSPPQPLQLPLISPRSSRTTSCSSCSSCCHRRRSLFNCL
jgi:hypothetical protein